MDFNEVAVYIKVVQSGSFSQAARQLGMPNSTVSSKISSLEKRLGVTLIQRTTRQLTVTPIGQAYFKKCLQGLTEIQSAEMEIAATQSEPQGLLRITAPVEMGHAVLPELIARYTTKFPKVRIELSLTERRVDLLAESFDLAIRAGELKDSSLIVKKLGTAYFALYASPAYLKSKGAPDHPRDLRGHQCLQFTQLGLDEWRLTGPRGTLSVALPGKIVVNDLIALKNLALLNQGILFIPCHFVAPEVKSGKLVRVLPEWRSALAPVHFVYPAQKFVTPKLTSFIDMATDDLRKIFADIPV